MKRPIQYFTSEYLDACKHMSPTAIAKFLEDFRLIAGSASIKQKSKLISIKIPERLLSAFRARCEIEGDLYQTKIKELMQSWLTNN